MEVDAALPQIELIEHPVISHPQLEFGTALKSLVLEILQPRAQIIHLGQNSLSCRWRKRIK